MDSAEQASFEIKGPFARSHSKSRPVKLILALTLKSHIRRTNEQDQQHSHFNALRTNKA